MAAALSAGALLLAGCDLNDGKALEVNPDSVQVNSAAVTNVLFTATNGTPPYTWTLDNYGWGTLSSSGAVATFTSIAIAGQNSVQVKDADGNLARAFIIGVQ